jgi:site-specific DNA-methyltransferase (adenine-specific)/site-specific DNA-methyltransferase (cytosine-N4-specific)
LFGPRFKNGFEPLYHFAASDDPKFRPDNVRHTSVEPTTVYAPASLDSRQGGTSPKDEKTYETALPSNVLFVDAPSGTANVGHSAAFPVGLPSFFIRAFSDEGDIIADPFMGSFSTGMAAEANGRRAVGMELSAGYVDVCLRRYVAKYPDADPVRHDGTKWSELT